MKKSLFLGLIMTFTGSVLFLGAVLFMFNWAESNWEESKSTHKSKLGSKVIFKKDTLSVVDYSVVENTITLSNGVKMNADFVNTLKVVK